MYTCICILDVTLSEGSFICTVELRLLTALLARCLLCAIFSRWRHVSNCYHTTDRHKMIATQFRRSQVHPSRRLRTDAVKPSNAFIAVRRDKQYDLLPQIQNVLMTLISSSHPSTEMLERGSHRDLVQPTQAETSRQWLRSVGQEWN